jgi:lipopolysaccharide export system permease protein
MRVRMQIQRGAVAAFSVLALATLGVPLGLVVNRSETVANLGLALALALVYYMLLFLFSLLQAHPALRPDLLLWTPNFLFEILGLTLLVRAART